MSRVLELRGLKVHAHHGPLVDGVDLDVHAGEVTALVGPSGSGKTVTARACLGVVDARPGIVRGALRLGAWPGEDVFAGVIGGGAGAMLALDQRLRPLRGRWIAYTPQGAASALNPGRTIGAQLARAARGAEPAPNLAELLRAVDLDPGVGRALPGELSGGQNQRAALAIALAASPRVLVADEPETGLDPLLRRRVVEVLVRASERRGVGVLLVTHYEDTVSRVAARVVRLSGPTRRAA